MVCASIEEAVGVKPDPGMVELLRRLYPRAKRLCIEGAAGLVWDRGRYRPWSDRKPRPLTVGAVAEAVAGGASVFTVNGVEKGIEFHSNYTADELIASATGR